MTKLKSAWFLSVVAVVSGSAVVAQDAPEKPRSEEVVQAAIQAMGGQAYLDVQTSVSGGRYFMFRKGRKGFTRFHDWTVYKDPVKSRFQLGQGKRQSVRIYNMELEKGWTLEGTSTVEPIPDEEIKDFSRVVNRDMDYIFRNRLGDSDVKMFYYGPDEVSGSGDLEAVEFVDAANNAVVVYFNRESHLPVKTESHFLDSKGLRHKEEVEFYNWHEFSGVLAPLRFDVYVDGELSNQRFLEELSLNSQIPNDYFVEPKIEEKNSKKKN